MAKADSYQKLGQALKDEYTEVSRKESRSRTDRDLIGEKMAYLVWRSEPKWAMIDDLSTVTD